jgi:hypothetical protein
VNGAAPQVRFIAGLGDVPAWDVCCTELPRKALTRHRLTPQRYRELRDAQDGVCGICGRGNWRMGAPVPLYVDHDHVCCADHRSACGRCVRGLLCSGCNGWLGELELWGWRTDDPDLAWWLPAAVAYLVRAGCDPTSPARRQLVEAVHRRKVAKWPQPCKCPLCDPAHPRASPQSGNAHK